MHRETGAVDWQAAISAIPGIAETAERSAEPVVFFQAAVSQWKLDGDGERCNSGGAGVACHVIIASIFKLYQNNYDLSNHQAEVEVVEANDDILMTELPVWWNVGHQNSTRSENKCLLLVTYFIEAVNAMILMMKKCNNTIALFSRRSGMSQQNTGAA